MIATEHLNQLTGLSTPTVVNVINLIQARPRGVGYAGVQVRALVQPNRAVVGFAATATCRTEPVTTNSGVPPMTTDALIRACEDIPSPRIIVIQDLSPEPRGAIFGEVLATAFQFSGYAGLATNGAGRDVRELEAMGFACWASGVMAGFAAGGFLSCGQPVTVAGLTVEPGDLLHADASGIVQVPHGLVSIVCDLGPKYDAIEKKFVERVKQSGGDAVAPSELSSALAEMRESFARLRESVEFPSGSSGPSRSH